MDTAVDTAVRDLTIAEGPGSTDAAEALTREDRQIHKAEEKRAREREEARIRNELAGAYIRAIGDRESLYSKDPVVQQAALDRVWAAKAAYLEVKKSS